MKICPYCGAENEKNALNCQLCNFEFKNTVNQPETSPPEAYQQNQEESAVSQKTRNSLYVIIVLLALIIIMGLIFGVPYLQNRNSDTENRSVTSENPTTTEIFNQPEPIPETENSVMMDENTVKEAIQKCYAVLQKRKSELGDWVSVEYACQDITGDSIPELFVAWGEMTDRSYQEIYAYQNGDYIYLDEFSTGSDEVLFVPEQKLLICGTSAYGAGCLTEYTIYQINSASLSEIDSYAYYDGGGYAEDIYYQHNGGNVTENEYTTGVNYYLNMDAVSLHYDKE